MTAQTHSVHLTRSGPVGAADFVEHVPGQRLQICRATVSMGDVPLAVTMFMPIDDRPQSISLDSLAESPTVDTDHGVPVLIRETETGRVIADVNPSNERHAAAIAAAAAVMQVSWGWDESDTIRVRVNGSWRPVTPRFTAGAWSATVGEPVNAA